MKQLFEKQEEPCIYLGETKYCEADIWHGATMDGIAIGIALSALILVVMLYWMLDRRKVI